MWVIKTRRAVCLLPQPKSSHTHPWPPQGRQTCLSQVSYPMESVESGCHRLQVRGRLATSQLPACLPCCQHCYWPDRESEQTRCHSAASELNLSIAFPGLAQNPNHTQGSECFGVALEQVMSRVGWQVRLSQLIMRDLDTNPWEHKNVASNQGATREHQLPSDV